MINYGSVMILLYSVQYIGFQSLQKSHFDEGPGRQELCPNSVVLIPVTKLKAVDHNYGHDLKAL